MAAGQIKLIVNPFYDCKISSAATMIKAVADVSELLKRERCIVLEPKLNVLVRWKFWRLRLLCFGLVRNHIGLSSEDQTSVAIK